MKKMINTDFAKVLLAAMLGLDEPALNQLFDDATRQLGFEQMMLHVAYPLLQRIGLMWLAETMSPIRAGNLRKAHALIESGRSRGKVVLAGF